MADMLSQEEINALLGGMNEDGAADEDSSNAAKDPDDLDSVLSSEEKDVLGEVGNITMGTAATTLFALLGQKVLITTPEVSFIKWKTISENYDRPCVGIRVNYVEGIQGSNVLILNHHDVKVITSLMMGWGGEVEGDDELTEIDLSAISEAMNQMIGSSSTSMASLMNKKVDIDTPVAFVIDFATHEMLENLGFEEEHAVCVQFRMQIGELIDSNIMQLLPIKFAKNLVDVMKSYISEPEAEAPQVTNQPPVVNQAPPPSVPIQNTGSPEGSMADMSMQQNMGYQQPPPQYIQQPGYAPQPQYAPGPQYMPQMNVQPAQFQNFDISDVMQQKENIEIIMDVPLEVTVELGRTTKKIKEILEFSPGSIIELNKLAGEHIDILVNGKFVAKGEVVVIDENFGIKVTDIINVEHRI